MEEEIVKRRWSKRPVQQSNVCDTFITHPVQRLSSTSTYLLEIADYDVLVRIQINISFAHAQVIIRNCPRELTHKNCVQQPAYHFCTQHCVPISSFCCCCCNNWVSWSACRSTSAAFLLISTKCVSHLDQIYEMKLKSEQNSISYVFNKLFPSHLQMWTKEV